MLFEEIIKYGVVSTGADHPVEVNGRYVMAPSPIPKFDNPKMSHSEALLLFGAGREKKIYAIPPFTDVASLDFDDHPFERENFKNVSCRLCGATNVFMDELIDESSGEAVYQCSDSNYCLTNLNRRKNDG
jgi:alpha-D-ribose 1-methylphosphonate 5-phosphate C-P lyase